MFEKVFVNDWVFNNVLSGIINNFEYCRYDKLYLDEKYSGLADRLFYNQKLIDEEMNKLKFKRRSTSSDIYKRLNRSIDFIESSYNKNISIDDISRVAAISKYHLIRLFKELYKTTPYNYLVKTRLGKAKNMLVVSDDSISSICDKLGYNSITTFTNVFKRHTGHSPAVYRTLNRRTKKAI